MTRNPTSVDSAQPLGDATSARGLRFALVVSRYHADVIDRLRRGAIDALLATGAVEDAITILPVPGSFEVPQAARYAAKSGRFDAIICLGCVIRGETSHFEYIASAVTHGVAAAAAETGIPMTFGVLTTNSVEEALARAGDRSANKGWEAALAAVELATLCRRLTRGEPSEDVG